MLTDFYLSDQVPWDASQHFCYNPTVTFLILFSQAFSTAPMAYSLDIKWNSVSSAISGIKTIFLNLDSGTAKEAELTRLDHSCVRVTDHINYKSLILSCIQFSNESLVQYHDNVWTEEDIIIFLCTLIRRHPSVSSTWAHKPQNYRTMILSPPFHAIKTLIINCP